MLPGSFGRVPLHWARASSTQGQALYDDRRATCACPAIQLPAGPSQLTHPSQPSRSSRVRRRTLWFRYLPLPWSFHSSFSCRALRPVTARIPTGFTSNSDRSANRGAARAHPGLRGPRPSSAEHGSFRRPAGTCVRSVQYLRRSGSGPVKLATGGLWPQAVTIKSILSRQVSLPRRFGPTAVLDRQ